MTGKQLARTLLIPLAMDTEPPPRSTLPQIPRRRVRFAAAGAGARIASSHFNQIIFANVIVDLAVATVCLRSTGHLGNRRHARSGSTCSETTSRTTHTA